MNASRTDTRHAYYQQKAIRDSFSSTVPIEYFRAMYDTSEEAEAMHTLHVSRIRFITGSEESEPQHG